MLIDAVAAVAGSGGIVVVSASKFVHWRVISQDVEFAYVQVDSSG